jgi:hypothetical protein
MSGEMVLQDRMRDMAPGLLEMCAIGVRAAR